MKINSPTSMQSQTYEHFEEIVRRLNRSEFYLMRVLISLTQQGSLAVTKTVACLANELLLGRRATNSVIKSLSSKGLIERKIAGGLFSTAVTVICHPHIVDIFNKPISRTKGGESNGGVKPKVVKRPSLPKEFKRLKDPSRLASVPKDVQDALDLSPAYWDFIREGFRQIAFNAQLRSEVQYRRVSDGERGGPQPNRSRKFHPNNALFQAKRAALFAMQEGLETTFQVDAEEHPLLLIDDLDAAALERLPDACAVLETSPGNYQATLIAPRSLSSSEFLLVQDGLFSTVGGGDHGAKGAKQLRRFPGSINNKPALSIPFVTRVERVSPRQVLSAEELDQLIKAGDKNRSLCRFDSKGKDVSRADVNVKSCPPEEDKQSQAVDNKIQTQTTDKSPSGGDFGKAIELMCKRWPDARIIEHIGQRALARKKNGHTSNHPSILDYATKTVAKARAAYRKPTHPRDE